jgi:hypothetical protein
MPEATVKSHSDTWVSQNAAHKNYGKGNRLWVRGAGSGLQRQSFISFAKPFPNNDALVVVSATLILRVKDDWAGSHDVTARRVTETWKEHRVTWTNAPSVTDSNAATETVNAAADGDEVDIDVTDILGDVALGADWFGVRLELDDDVGRTFYASDSPKGSYHPQLEVEWGFAPYPPTDLDPAGGQVVGIATPVLQWRFPDIVQENTQAASQVQISTSSSFASPTYDSGKVSNTVHRWPLAGETTIPDGSTRYWRVRTWDDQNRGSGWSDTARFSRVSKGVITFVNPGPSHTVDDLTPLVSWTFTGNQDRVRLVLQERLPDKTLRQRWDSGQHHYLANHLTVPNRKRHPLIKSGRNYRFQLYIWDTEDRVGVSNDRAFSYAQIDFTYSRSGVPSSVGSLTATVLPIAPVAVVLTWTRASTPDWFALVANGEEVYHRLEPADYATGVAGQYQFIYWGAEPREATTYEIEAVVSTGDHAQHSAGNPQRTVTTNPTGVWLIDDDADEAVALKGTDTPSITIGESGTTYDLVGNRMPVRIVDSIRGYEGSFAGMVTSAAARDTLLEMKGKDKELRVVIANLNFPVYLEEVTVSPMAIPGGEMHEASFAFFQSDEFFDADREENY